MDPLAAQFDHLELVFSGRREQWFAALLRMRIHRCSSFLDGDKIVWFALTVVKLLQILHCVVQLLNAFLSRDSLGS